MKLACTITEGRGETNRLLTDVAARLEARGVRLCGTVQTDTAREGSELCDMDVRVLPGGPIIRISQNLGPNARGCRLDPEALEQAVGQTLTALEDGAQLMIVNKFGKHEAEGRGFREAIGVALSKEVPVLVGINRLNLDAFQAFCDGAATELNGDIDAAMDWANSVLDAETQGT